MRTADSAVVTVAEARSLFSGLETLPALVLAVSGGPDSTALLWLAARWREALKQQPSLLAVTVDHGLRPEAAREAVAVKKLAGKLGIAHRTLRWRGRKPKTGLQQAARHARYALLAQAAREARASHILTAHTLDDQAETVLIRLTRGSGLSGLAAMRRFLPLPGAVRAPSPACGGGLGRGKGAANMPPPAAPSPFELWRATSPASGRGEEKNAAYAAHHPLLVRPLLEIPKTRLIATLRAAGIDFADDPSNRDPRFTRARLRSLMPELAREGLDAPRLALLARRLRRADAAIEEVVDRAAAMLGADVQKKGPIVIPAAALARLPAEISLRLLGRAVARLGDEGPVELGKMEALNAALQTAQGSGARFRRTLAGAIVTLASGQLVVERAPARRGKTLTKRQGGKAKRAKKR